MHAFQCDIPVPHRRAPLRVGVSVPRGGGRHPVVLFSHGAGLVGSDYAPLLECWAKCGLVVVYPVHEPAPDRGELWRLRVHDIAALASGLAAVEEAVPALRGRFDHGRMRVAGHSFGGHTAAIVLGGRVRGEPVVAPVASVGAGLLLAAPGDGAPGRLLPEWQSRAPYLDLDWSGLRRPALFVVGVGDESRMSPRGWRWRADGFHLSPPGDKLLLVCRRADHYFGGIVAGRGMSDPAGFAELGRLTGAYLRDGFAELPGPDMELYRR